MYASETYVLKEKEIRMFSIWERKNFEEDIWSKGRKEGNEWRIRNNQVLRNVWTTGHVEDLNGWTCGENGK
jgi:hypothetical protein